MLNKIILSILFCVSVCLLPLYGYGEDFNVQSKSVFQWDTRADFIAYYFQDNTTHAFLQAGGYYVVLSYNNKAFDVVKTSSREYRGFDVADSILDDFAAENQMIGNTGGERTIKVGDNLYIGLFGKSTNAIKVRSPLIHDPIVIIENGKEYEVENCSYVGDLAETLFVDHKNLKVYFRGEVEEKTGIAVCDVKKKEAKLIFKDDDNNKKWYNPEYNSPIRIPNTGFLMFCKLPGFYSGKFTTDILIAEIPEWKAEIEKQKENERLYPKAKKYLINGPANIRDNPKGKSIAYLNDFTEVLVIEQSGDWYKVVYADVIGWTFKDNLRINT